jgi:hypothetical protein
MGNLATPEFLIARWSELCRDPSLEDLPYKIELNAWGKIEMSPASNRPGRLQAEKTAAYLQAGALEVWIVAEDASIRYFTASGEQPKSGFPVEISLPPPIK